MSFIPNGSAVIQKMIDDSCRTGLRAATVTGRYEISTAVRIPSDFTLILENCHLRMADNVYSNMFVNASHGTEKGRTPEGTDRNIIVEGRGRVILDGGEYNGLSERTHSKNGLPHISLNNVLLFTNVDGFTIRNLHVRNQRWWALNFVSCRNGRIQDIDFCADDSWVDDDGSIHHGFSSRVYGTEEETGFSYQKIRVKNADGIDLRSGCHDILIENITGFTEDDTIALTGLIGSTENMYCVEGEEPAIYNVIIRNVMSSAFCANVRLLNQSGVKLYNILVDGVVDTSKGSPHMDRGGTAVRIGDNHLYGTRHATADETRNIVIRNVSSRAGAAMRVAGAMSDCLFENIRNFDGSPILIQNDATVDISKFIR